MLEKAVRRRLTAVLLGNALLRIAGSAGGALVGFYLADLANRGQLVSAAIVGLLGVVINSAELGGAIPFGILADRVSARFVLVSSALLGAVATQLFGLTSLIPIFFLSRLLEGFSGAAVTPAILAHLSRVTETRRAVRGRVMSVFEVSLLAGLALGTLVGGGLWDAIQVWAFSAMALVYLAVALLFAWGARPVDDPARAAPAPATPAGDDTALPRPEDRDPLRGLRAALRDPLLLRLAPAWLAANTVVGLWTTYTPFLLTLRDEAAAGQYLVGLMTAGQVGIAALFYALVFAGGILAWGVILDRTPISRVRAMRVAIGGMFAVTLCFYLLNVSAGWAIWQRVVVLVAYAISIAVQSGVTPAALAYLADVADQSPGRGAAMGVYTLLLGLGGILGSGLGSLLARDYYFNGLLLGTLGLGIIGYAALRLLPSGDLSGEQ